MSSLPYNPRLRARARELRNQSTLAEILLWNHLKRGQRHGHDFHRQKPILEWIADFYCTELKLVVEIDGETHRFKPDSDQTKESAFRSLGITTLRFGDAEVKKNAAGVIAIIDRWIEASAAAPTSSKHTPAFGHPSLEGTSATAPKGLSHPVSANEAIPQNAPLERGGRAAPGCVRP